MSNIMLDTETLATSPNAVILTFAAIKFDPYSDEEPGPGIYYRLNVDEQTALGREVNDDTLNWWFNQNEDVREEALSEEGRISIIDFTKELNRFVVGVNDIWAQGPVFDIPIIESLYKQLGVPVPWNYWQISDSRTLSKLKRGMRHKEEAAHNALVDCYAQAKTVQAIYKHYNIKKDEREEREEH